MDDGPRRSLGVTWIAAPVDATFGHRPVSALTPDVEVIGEGDVGEDGVARDGGDGGGIGF